MSLGRYELGFYIPEDGILHSQSRETLKSHRLRPQFNNVYTRASGSMLQRRLQSLSSDVCFD
jgi:hypothetical protein